MPRAPQGKGLPSSPQEGSFILLRDFSCSLPGDEHGARLILVTERISKGKANRCVFILSKGEMFQSWQKKIEKDNTHWKH